MNEDELKIELFNFIMESLDDNKFFGHDDEMPNKYYEDEDDTLYWISLKF